MSSAASRLQGSLAASSFAASPAHSAVAEKLRVVCDVVNDLSARFGASLDALWSRRFAAFEEQLADCADYMAVISAGGRPPISAPEIRTLDVLADQLLSSIS
jgi:hypothetical protein